jgi:predicted transcriptional regulator
MDRKKKPTLLSIRQHTQISSQQLAKEAGVSLTETYVVEIGGFTHEDVAKKVIAAFVKLSGMYYMLDDIRLHNVPSTRAHHKVVRH